MTGPNWLNGNVDAASIDCTDFVVLVDELLEAFPQEGGPIVTRHLNECPPCVIYLQQMQDLRILLNLAFRDEKLDDTSVERVVSAITTLEEGFSDVR